MELLLGISVAILLTIIFSLFRLKRMNKSWDGTITKIKGSAIRIDEDLLENVYKIHYRTDSGKKGKFTVPEYTYNKYYKTAKKGSRLIKEKGAEDPRLL